MLCTASALTQQRPTLLETTSEMQENEKQVTSSPRPSPPVARGEGVSPASSRYLGDLPLPAHSHPVEPPAEPEASARGLSDLSGASPGGEVLLKNHRRLTGNSSGGDASTVGSWTGLTERFTAGIAATALTRDRGPEVS